jgi:hypothetical protein
MPRMVPLPVPGRSFGVDPHHQRAMGALSAALVADSLHRNTMPRSSPLSVDEDSRRFGVHVLADRLTGLTGSPMAAR